MAGVLRGIESDVASDKLIIGRGKEVSGYIYAQ